MADFEKRIKIGGLIIALKSEKNQGNFTIEDSYRNFTTCDQPHIILNLQYRDIPSVHGWKQVFDSGGVWKLFQHDGKWAVCMYSPAYGTDPFQVAILENDFTCGEIFDTNSQSDHKSALFPLRYPLGEVLMINLMARGRGVLLHACAVKDAGKGLIFAGVSGGGKSTMARLWRTQDDAVVLSDDRVILRKRDGRYWLFGTPWHGDAHAASPLAVQLDEIFILKHAPENQIVHLKPLEAATQLFVRAFPTIWDQEGVDFTLGFLNDLVQSVPCYELGFVPDHSVLDFLRCQRSN